MAYSNNIFLCLLGFLWIIIPIIDFTGVLFLDEKYFAFRAWEVVQSETGEGPFKPDTEFGKVIFGDLANLLKIRRFCQFRHQRFTTDSFGFRNPLFENAYFPIVVIGDSDMAGSSLSDEEIFSVQLSKRTGFPAYNYAPMSPVAFLADKRFREYPPKILIWESVERTIKGELYRIYASIPVNSKISLTKQSANRPPQIGSPKLVEHHCKWIYHEIRWLITGRHNPSVGYIDESTGLLFYQPGIDTLHQNRSQKEIKDIVDGIVRIKDICEQRNIQMIYMPLPDKENIYQENLPNFLRPEQRKDPFLTLLHTRLDQRDILSINLFDAFREQKGKDLYFLDDTHWNSTGVSIAVDETEKILRTYLKSDETNSIE